MDVFMEEVLRAREPPSDGAINAFSKLFRGMTQTEFEARLAPALEKALRRSPEVCVPALRRLIVLSRSLRVNLLSSSCSGMLDSLIETAFGKVRTCFQALQNPGRDC